MLLLVFITPECFPTKGPWAHESLLNVSWGLPWFLLLSMIGMLPHYHFIDPCSSDQNIPWLTSTFAHRCSFLFDQFCILPIAAFCRDFPTDCRPFFAPLFCLPMSVRSLFAPYWPFHPYSGSHPLKWDLRIYAQPKLPPVAPQTSFESKVKVFRLTDSLISVSVWPLRQFLMGHRSRPFNPDEPIE